MLQAMAVPMSSSESSSRKQLAQCYGFLQFGKPSPPKKGGQQQIHKRNFRVLVNAFPAGQYPKQVGFKPLLYGIRKRKMLQAIAVQPVPMEAPSEVSSTEELRKELAERYGFVQIGEPLPDNVKLKDIITSLPKKVFEIDDVKAWRSVFVTLSSYALGIYMTAKAPWYLLPLAWAWTGTAFAGFFVIGHDCAHKCFSRNKLVEDIVGTLAFMPLIYPYEPWRFKHDEHHAHTNKLFVDTAWHPIMKRGFPASPLLRKALVYGYGPFRCWMTIPHWLLFHFDLNKFKKQQVKRCMISLAAVYAFMGVGWPLIVYNTGIVGWIKFWLLPFLGFHFWMSTATMVHHTAPHIPFKPARKWNAAQAQLNGTVHCNYPRWVDFLTHDLSVHIPHHVSTKIPSYNLRDAQQSLDENWGKYLNKATWSWRLMKMIMTTCHVYDKDQNYLSFEQTYPNVAQPIEFLRRVMPDQA